jgi:hypothetical protein
MRFTFFLLRAQESALMYSGVQNSLENRSCARFICDRYFR